MNSDCKDTTLLGSFSENHDQPRFASYTDDLTVGFHPFFFFWPCSWADTYLLSSRRISSPTPCSRTEFPSVCPPTSILSPVTKNLSLPRSRTALLRSRRSLRPRSPLAVQIQHFRATLQTHSIAQCHPLACTLQII